jgi:hypothetical protein
MADVSNKITELENEIKVIKNEVKAILLDIREQYLNAENPFYGRASQGGANNMIINKTASARGSQEQPAEVPDFSDLTREDSQTPPSDVSGTDEARTAAPHEEKNGKEGTLPALTLEPDEDDSPQKQEKKNKTVSNLNAGPVVNKKGIDMLQEMDDDSLQEILHDDERPVVRYKTGRGNNHRINLITIAGLSRWVDESTEKIGKERTEVMVDACHMVGHMPADLKDLVIRLVRLSQVDEPKKGKVNTRDYLGVIAQLDNLMGYNSESESALLSILTNTKETNSG